MFGCLCASGACLETEREIVILREREREKSSLCNCHVEDVNTSTIIGSTM